MAVVRYFGKEYGLASFSSGWRGFLIRVLALVIAKLERVVERMAVRYLAESHGLPSDSAKQLQAAYDKESERREFKTLVNELLHPEGAKFVDSRAEKYEQSTRAIPEGSSYREQRTNRATKFFISQMAPGRSGRYAGPPSKRVADPEGDTMAKWDSTKKEWEDVPD